ncbi:MAG: response regulator transcription factor [Candidatus Flexifilum sp.]|jgi:two-component system alkaline phosphatase synthesis response regulator PhoP
MYEIMVVDDDIQTLDMLSLILKREGYRVVSAQSGEEALALLERTNVDLFVLDAVLPDLHGVTLCQRIRSLSQFAHTPIMFLTGHGTTQSAVDALMAGGDDYLRKPFASRVLIARVRALLRRVIDYTDTGAPLIRIRSADYQIFIDDREIHLTRIEFELLKYLCRAPYHLHSVEELLTNVWRYPAGVGDAALVRNHIHNIRRKIEIDPERPTILQSRHGRGYMIKARTQIDDRADVAQILASS